MPQTAGAAAGLVGQRVGAHVIAAATVGGCPELLSQRLVWIEPPHDVGRVTPGHLSAALVVQQAEVLPLLAHSQVRIHPVEQVGPPAGLLVHAERVRALVQEDHSGLQDVPARGGGAGRLAGQGVVAAAAVAVVVAAGGLLLLGGHEAGAQRVQHLGQLVVASDALAIFDSTHQLTVLFFSLIYLVNLIIQCSFSDTYLSMILMLMTRSFVITILHDLCFLSPFSS